MVSLLVQNKKLLLIDSRHKASLILSLLLLGAAPSVHSPMFCVFVYMRVFVRTFESTRQLSGKEHICQFALAVCQSAVVASLAVKVMETDPAEVVCQR